MASIRPLVLGIQPHNGQSKPQGDALPKPSRVQKSIDVAKKENIPPAGVLLKTLDKVDPLKCSSASTQATADDTTSPKVSSAASSIFKVEKKNPEDERKLLYEDMTLFVETFLEPYLMGTITRETDDPQRKPLIEILRQRYGKKCDARAEEHLFRSYLHAVVKGMYIHRARQFEPYLRELIHNKYYDRFLIGEILHNFKWLRDISASPSYDQLVQEALTSSFENAIKTNPKAICTVLSLPLVKLLFDYHQGFQEWVARDTNPQLNLPAAHTLEQALIYHKILPEDLATYMPAIEENVKRDFPNLFIPEGILLALIKIALNEVNAKRQSAFVAHYQVVKKRDSAPNLQHFTPPLKLQNFGMGVTNPHETSAAHRNP